MFVILHWHPVLASEILKENFTPVQYQSFKYCIKWVNTSFWSWHSLCHQKGSPQVEYYEFCHTFGNRIVA